MQHVMRRKPCKRKKMKFRHLVLGTLFASSPWPAIAADVWLATSTCTKLPNTTIQAQFDSLRSRWGEHLEILAEPHKSKEGTFFLAVAHAQTGENFSFLVSDSEAMCRKAVQKESAPPRPIKGWGGTPAWNWSDASLLKHSKAWRSVNLGGHIDCTWLGQDGAMSLERAFVGQVAHIDLKGVPTVLMVRDQVQVYLMPLDLASCRAFAKTIYSEASR